MNPIVNPIWFYIISVFNGLKVMSGILLMSIVVLVICTLATSFDDINWEMVENKKITKMIIIVSTICASVILFVPNEETMYKMMIASYITEENVEIAKGEVKELIDYIAEKIKGE